ncbi:hypothetical protein [Streptomyces sp. NPDC002133]|uniref:hypothetical protein n=1 Tax=Streptomyces sp. NPDC002133 TaxID=3154409 RepID=UPI003326269C
MARRIRRWSSPACARPGRAEGVILGMAYSVRDVAALLQTAGLQDFDEMDVVRSDLIEWRGGGPDVWAPQQYIERQQRPMS